MKDKRGSMVGTVLRAVLVLLLILAPSAAVAQQDSLLRGTIVDGQHRRPLVGALIEIRVAGDSTIRANARSDSLGQFTIRRAGANDRLSVRMFGFWPLDAALGERGERLNITLTPLPVELASIEVTGPAGLQRRLETKGFFARRMEGMGRFMEAEDIDRTNAPSLRALLRPFMHGCGPTFYFVDGLRIIQWQDVALQNVIGMEVYKGTSFTPAEFRADYGNSGPSRSCSFVIWTGIRIPQDDAVRQRRRR